MPTDFFCSHCGGIVSASGNVQEGRACVCGQPPAADPNATSSIAAAKVCSVCGVDVAGKKRMKDRQGRYWCYECGIADQQKKLQSGQSMCLECCQSFPKEQLVEWDGTRLCAACHSVRVAKKSKSLSGKAALGRGRLAAIVAVAAVLAIFAVYQFMH